MPASTQETKLIPNPAIEGQPAELLPTGGNASATPRQGRVDKDNGSACKRKRLPKVEIGTVNLQSARLSH